MLWNRVGDHLSLVVIAQPAIGAPGSSYYLAVASLIIDYAAAADWSLSAAWQQGNVYKERSLEVSIRFDVPVCGSCFHRVARSQRVRYTTRVVLYRMAAITTAGQTDA